MQNQNTLVMSILVMVVGAAAFIGGRFWYQSIGPAGSISVTILPAIELPTMSPVATGPFVERQDNTITIETKSLSTSGAIAISADGTKRESGPKVDIVITSETMIYRETTQLSEPLSNENQIIQQTVDETTLEDIGTHSMVMVWGRKSGGRIIAEVFMYSDTKMIKRGIFEDCNACP